MANASDNDGSAESAPAARHLLEHPPIPHGGNMIENIGRSLSMAVLTALTMLAVLAAITVVFGPLSPWTLATLIVVTAFAIGLLQGRRRTHRTG
jgi:hypothetical protein